MFGNTKRRLAELEARLTVTSAQLEAVRAAADDDGPGLAVDQYEGLAEVFGVGGTYAGPAVTPEIAMKASVVFACTRVIAGAFAAMPVHVYERTPEGRRRVEHEVWWLLNEQPAPEWTAASFWERIVADSLLQGDGFAEIVRGRGGKVIGFLRIDPRSVTVRRSGGRLHYLILDAETGKARGLDQDDVLHFPGFGFDGARGMSVIRWAAYQALGIAFAAEEHSARFLANGAKPSVVISLTGAVTPEQEDKFQRKLERGHTGAGVFRPLVLGKGATATTLALSPEDAQLLQSRIFQVEEICRAFGVPPFMVGANDKTTSWGTGIEQLGIGFVRHTLGAPMRRFEQELNRKLWPRSTRYFAEFHAAALMRGDAKAENDAHRQALGGSQGPGWTTVNEVRRIQNLPPIAGGDDLYKPDPAKPAAAPAPAEEPAKEPNAPENP